MTSIRQSTPGDEASICVVCRQAFGGEDGFRERGSAPADNSLLSVFFDRSSRVKGLRVLLPQCGKRRLLSRFANHGRQVAASLLCRAQFRRAE